MSAKVPLFPVLVGAAIASIVVIVFSVLYVRGKVGKVLRVEIPENWILYNGKCYYFSDKHYTWSESQKFCESHNSSLAVIDDVKELNFLKRFKDYDNHWIGLSRTEDDSGWVWTNGMPYTENLFPIERLQKNVDSEHVFLNHDGVKSGSGKIEKKWFCKKSLPNYSS